LAAFVTVSQLQKGWSKRALLVDVRSVSEFAAGHIAGAVNIPMDQIEGRVADLGADIPLVLICQSGKRAQITAKLLEPCGRQIAILEGGTKSWIASGHAVVASVKTRWSLERQVRLGAGFLTLVGAVLALSVRPSWLYLCGLIGLGLTFAGLTDFCPMALILERMPWNRRSYCSLGRPSSEGVLGRSGTGS